MTQDFTLVNSESHSFKMVVDLRVQAFLASHEPDFLEMKTLLMLQRRLTEDRKATGFETY